MQRIALRQRIHPTPSISLRGRKRVVGEGQRNRETVREGSSSGSVGGDRLANQVMSSYKWGLKVERTEVGWKRNGLKRLSHASIYKMEIKYCSKGQR